MLDLNSPEWARLRHAYGSARDVPGMIRDLVEGKDDPWDRLWGALCHQGSVTPASFAAVPHLVALAERQPAKEQFMFWTFVGAVAADGGNDGRGLPDHLGIAYVKALERAVPLIHQLLMSRQSDETDAIYLLQSLAAMRGTGHAGSRLDCLVDNELQGNCPGCDAVLFLEIVDEGVYATLSDPSREAVHDRIWVQPAARDEHAPPTCVGDLHRVPCSQWLPEFAERAGHPGLGDRIRWLYGRATCPGCGKVFKPIDDLSW
jgi:hypothetical protein